jgi:hypothetical protein
VTGLFRRHLRRNVAILFLRTHVATKLFRRQLLRLGSRGVEAGEARHLAGEGVDIGEARSRHVPMVVLSALLRHGGELLKGDLVALPIVGTDYGARLGVHLGVEAEQLLGGARDDEGVVGDIGCVLVAQLAQLEGLGLEAERAGLLGLCLGVGDSLLLLIKSLNSCRYVLIIICCSYAIG